MAKKDEDGSPTLAEIKLDPRIVLLVEPNPERLKIAQDILKEVLVGSTITSIDDIDDAEEALDEDNFDTVIIDFGIDGVTTSDFVKVVNNEVDIELISFNIDNVDTNDDNNRFKLEPLKKLFEKEKIKKTEEGD